MGIGLFVTGIASYAFLVLSARALGPEAYGGLAVLWISVYMVGPGFFIPLEQEVSRLVAARTVHDLGSGPIIRRAATLGIAFTFVILAASVALAHPITDHVFTGDMVLFVGLLVGVVGYYIANLAKGVLSGHGKFGRYGLYLGGESAIRLAICVLCIAVGTTTPGPFGLALGIAPVLALIPAFAGVRGLFEAGPPARWRDLTMSLGILTAGSIFAQVLVNAPPLLAEVLNSADSAAVGETTVGAFTAALILARVPFFLFQAVQAALLPSLAKLVARHEYRRFWRGLVTLVGLVGGLAAIGTVIAFIVGADIVKLFFGSDFVVTNRTVGMLTAGSSLYLVAMALAQAVIALAAPRFVAIGWGIGAIALVIVSVFGPSGLFAIEIGYVVGSGAAVATMCTGLWMLWSSDARDARPHK